MPALHRVTLSLPPTVASDLRVAAKRLGVSQSGLLVALLTPAVSQVAKLAALSPPRGKKASAVQRRRFRGASIAAIKEAVTQAVDVAAGLNEELPLEHPPR